MPKKAEEVQNTPSLKRVLAEINKQYGANTIGTVNNMENVMVTRISTGIPTLDTALGGGFPVGRMIELYGIPSSGKSLISLSTIKQAQDKGLDCIYIDCEDSFDPEFAKAFGVDMDKLALAQVSVGEDTLDLIVKLLKAEPGLIVIDSVAAMVTRAEMEEDFDQQFMAIKARLLSRGLAKINALNKKTMLLFINQLRSTMQMYGAPTTTTGGRALGHYASIRMEVKQGDKLTVDNKKTGDVLGQTVQFKITKNKTAPPYKYGAFKFWYDGARLE